jgi:ATP-dependent DNA helicase RecG
LHAAKRAQKRFHLVVTDEQHKFSTQQKAALASTFTNTLEATATAIPRSLALVAYGDMDVSVLRECPVQKCIDTKIVNADEEQKVTQFVRRIVGDGGQVAVIYPLVDKGAGAEVAGDSDSPATARQGVMDGFEAWNARFPGRVGVLHGKQSSDEKAAVIEAMKAKKIDVLVSTLVLEVGVTLPSLKALLVTSPECFGLAQLHQLRGRVARHGGQGWMVVLARSDLTEESMERLRTLRACNDGFQLAEHDMNIRGFGDVSMYGSAQVGGHRVLFHNTGLTHDEIKASAQRLGMRI